MGKMKALSLDMEEHHVDKHEQQEQEAEFDVVMEEMHYVHTINEICNLFVLHGWDKVWPDIQETMRAKKW